jgi:hypothetical protein
MRAIIMLLLLGGCGTRTPSFAEAAAACATAVACRQTYDDCVEAQSNVCADRCRGSEVGSCFEDCVEGWPDCVERSLGCPGDEESCVTAGELCEDSVHVLVQTSGEKRPPPVRCLERCSGDEPPPAGCNAAAGEACRSYRRVVSESAGFVLVCDAP